MNGLPLVSVVVPVFQNERSLFKTCSDVAAVLAEHEDRVTYEFVLVNDGSSDGSWEEMTRFQRQRRERVSLIDLSRNFGQVPALLAGYRHAHGQCIVSISADQQEPPLLVWEMCEGWLGGSELVVGRRATRDDGVVINLVSGLSWKLLRRFVNPNLPDGGFDVFAMDRKVRDFLVEDPEQNVFLQGRLLFYAPNPRVIPYERKRSLSGRSQTGLSRRITYFIDAFAASSYLPLRTMSALGVALSLVALFSAVWTIWYVLAFGSPVAGWASLMVVVLFLGGIQMLSFGVLGEYLWRTLQQTRRLPHYVIRSVITNSPSASRIEGEASDYPDASRPG